MAEPKCKGLYFRYTDNCFMNSHGVLTYTSRLTPLKKMSCDGCAECGYINEHINEELAIYGREYPFPMKLIHGKIYTPHIEITSTDFETGYADEWEVVYKEAPDD